MRDTLTIIFGGEAGQGLATCGSLAAQMATGLGHNFLTFQGYHSRIRGGHNTFALKLGSDGILGPDGGADIVIALDGATAEIDGPSLRPGGLLLSKGDARAALAEVRSLAVPYDEMGKEREYNMVALGLFVAALAWPLGLAEELVTAKFKDGAEKPLAALRAGHLWAEKEFGGAYAVNSAELSTQRLILSGNEALALGSVAGGTKFCSFYPMSPATTVALTLASLAADCGLIVEQAEDEIAAINMAIGAAYAGAPALVPTSGGGFALMTEGVSLAAMTETPLTVVLVQRPGPATGLPTRTEQADLNLVLYAGHGEFPRAILAPATTGECFTLGAKAMNLAEESQGPVFILTDQFLADSTIPITPFTEAELPPPVEPFKLHEENMASLKEGEVYRRFDLEVENGLSPRLLPGFSEHLVKVDSDEHDCLGHLTEDLTLRVAMQDKRQKKMAILKDKVIAPQIFGAQNPELLLVSWGSTLGATWEACRLLNEKGTSAGLLHFSQVYPLAPADWLPLLLKAERVVFVEGNSEGQFAMLVRRETGFAPASLVCRYDGLPLDAVYILNKLEVK